jgi:hypothetical protein
MLDSAMPVYETNGPGITFPPSATSTLIKLRYNVVDTAETNPAWTTFSFSCAGVSSTGSVSAILFQSDITTGANTAICSVASGTTSGLKSCSFSSTTFDFTQYNYWILAAVSRTDTSSLPTLISLSVDNRRRATPSLGAARHGR